MNHLKKKIILFILLVSSFYLTGIFALPIAVAAPAAPSNLTATTQSSSSIQLQWQDNSTNETGFKIERSLNPAGPFYLVEPNSGANVTSRLVTGLADNMTYYFRVAAYDATGTSPYSNLASATTTLLPAAPTNLTATAFSHTQINLQWADNSTNETGFKVERASADSGSWNEVGITGSNTTIYSNTGLSPWTAYYYRVAAYNTAGNSAYTNIANAATPAPPSIPNPSTLGFLSDIGDPGEIVIPSGSNIAYFSSPPFGLVALNISDPNQPEVYGPNSSQHPYGNENGNSLAVSGNTAVTPSSRGTDIIDISDPSYPKVVTSIATGSLADVAISDNYAYVAAGGDLKVIDISMPAASWVVKTITTPGTAYGLAVKDNDLVLSDITAGGSTLRLYDISTPDNPIEKSFVPSSVLNSTVNISKISITTINNRQYATALIDSNSFKIFDITNLSLPEKVGEFFDPNLAKSIADVVLEGNYAYLSGSVSTGVTIIDLSTPSAPRIIGQYDPGGGFTAHTLALSDQKAFVNATFNGTSGVTAGIKVIDVSIPSNMREIGSLQRKSKSNQLVISGNTVVAVGSERGTDIIDVSNSSKPRILSSIAGGSIGVAISGNYAYVTSGGDLRVIDLSDPVSARVVKTVVTPSVAWGVAISGNLLVVTDSLLGIHTYNIAGSFAADPQKLGTAILSGTPITKVAIATINDIMYALVVNGGKLQIVNLQNPAAPYLVKEITTYISNVVVTGNYAYVSGGKGLVVVNISDPPNAFIAGNYDTPSTSPFNSVAIYNNMVFASFGGSGNTPPFLATLDIKNPASPTKIGNDFFAISASNDVITSGNKIYVADSKTELVIMDIYHDELKVTKTPSVYQASSGQEITYTLAINNPSPNTMTNLTITDPIPTGTTFVSADNGGRVISGKVTWDPTSTPALATFAPSANLTLTFRVRVN